MLSQEESPLLDELEAVVFAQLENMAGSGDGDDEGGAPHLKENSTECSADTFSLLELPSVFSEGDLLSEIAESVVAMRVSDPTNATGSEGEDATAHTTRQKKAVIAGSEAEYLPQGETLHSGNGAVAQRTGVLRNRLTEACSSANSGSLGRESTPAQPAAERLPPDWVHEATSERTEIVPQLVTELGAPRTEQPPPVSPLRRRTRLRGSIANEASKLGSACAPRAESPRSRLANAFMTGSGAVGVASVRNRPALPPPPPPPRPKCFTSFVGEAEIQPPPLPSSTAFNPRGGGRWATGATVATKTTARNTRYFSPLLEDPEGEIEHLNGNAGAEGDTAEKAERDARPRHSPKALESPTVPPSSCGVRLPCRPGRSLEQSQFKLGGCSSVVFPGGTSERPPRRLPDGIERKGQARSVRESCPLPSASTTTSPSPAASAMQRSASLASSLSDASASNGSVRSVGSSSLQSAHSMRSAADAVRNVGGRIHGWMTANVAKGAKPSGPSGLRRVGSMPDGGLCGRGADKRQTYLELLQGLQKEKTQLSTWTQRQFADYARHKLSSSKSVARLASG